jgi:hypothetical protein
MARRLSALLLAAISGIACTGGREISSPCDLADADTVQAAMSGTVAEGVEGDLNNCDFDIENGFALAVTVYDYGGAGDWDGLRQGFVDNRGGVTDIEGLGDAAFYPNDAGPRELVVQAGGHVFSVSVFSGLEEPSTGAVNGLADLARTIVDGLTS